MTNEKYLEKLIGSYEEIIYLQKCRIKELEKVIEDYNSLSFPRRARASYTKFYDYAGSEKEEEPITVKPVEKEITVSKPEFGSLSSKQPKTETLQDYISRGGITELKKTEPIPTPVVPTPIGKKEKRPRVMRRQIFFKAHSDAESFIDRYTEDFEIGKVKHHVKSASEVHYEIKKNTTNNDLFARGYSYVLIFQMNGVDFKAIEELENLKKYHTPGERRGAQCIRLFYNKEKEKVV